MIGEREPAGGHPDDLASSPAEQPVPYATAPQDGVGIPAGTWMPKHVLWGIFALIGLVIVESLVIGAIDPDLESLGATLGLQLAVEGTLVGVAFGFATMPGSGFANPITLGLRRFRLSALGLALAVYGAYIAFAAFYAPLVQPEQEDITRDLGFGESALASVIAGFLIIGVAPFCEEVFFRGFMFGGLRRRMSLWPAAALSGAIFGLFHFTGADSIGVVPQLAVLGMLLAWLYEHTGSLWPAIAVHTLNNALAFIIVTSS